jgi:hypothetical protein
VQGEDLRVEIPEVGIVLVRTAPPQVRKRSPVDQHLPLGGATLQAVTDTTNPDCGGEDLFILEAPHCCVESIAITSCLGTTLINRLQAIMLVLDMPAMIRVDLAFLVQWLQQELLPGLSEERLEACGGGSSVLEVHDAGPIFGHVVAPADEQS